FWQAFTRLAWEQAERAPSEADRENLLRSISAAKGRGKVVLVGAGPGDPELLTLKAVRALQAATFILYDDLVGPEILELARREAVRIAVGKTGHGADGRLPRDLDWAAIADPLATTAIYMPRRTLAEFAREAIAHGLAAGTPAVAISSATLPAQQHVSGPLEDLPALAHALAPGAP